MRAWTIASFLLPAALAAQKNPQLPVPPVELSRADQIRIAKSAAPEDLSKNAKVWVLENGHYIVAVQGTSGMGCTIIRTRPNELTPQCGDAEADATILTIYRFWTEQRLAGKTQDEIKAEVKSRLTSGQLRAPQHPALIYMTSSVQVISDPNGENRTHFIPHLMIFYPNMQKKAMEIPESNSMDVPILADEDSPMSQLVVVLRDWTEPARATQ
jgi:hypothetical protein